MPEDRAVTYLGGLVLASVLTAVVIASLLPGRTWLHTLLELRPMEWVGERSYGLYLWHWPVLLLMLAALPAQEAGSLGYWMLRLVAVVLTVVVAELSYRWVETPIRRQGFRAWALGRLEAVRRSAPEGTPILSASSAFEVMWLIRRTRSTSSRLINTLGTFSPPLGYMHRA